MLKAVASNADQRLISQVIVQTKGPEEVIPKVTEEDCWEKRKKKRSKRCKEARMKEWEVLK